MTNQALVEAINTLSHITASDRGEYVRVAHPYKGVSAANAQDKIEIIAKKHGYTYHKVREFGNGMIQCCTYEIQLRKAA